MKIELCTAADFLQILEELTDFWGSDRTRHLHHPMLVHEFGNTAFVIRESSSAESSSAKSSAADRSVPDRSVPDRSVADRSVADRSVADRSVADNSLAGRPAAEREIAPWLEPTIAPIAVPTERRVIAYLFGFFSQTEPAAYVHLAAVRISHRGRGLGRLLYAHFAQAAQQARCTNIKAITTPTNAESIRFHHALGFELEGDSMVGGVPVMHNYSGPGQDRVVLRRAISPVGAPLNRERMQ